jgi:hypothetical protein
VIGRITIRLLALVALCTLSASAQSRAKRVTPVGGAQRSGFDSQAKIAIVVGVGAYPARSGLSELRYSASDVDAVGEALDAQGYTVIPLKDSAATRPAILRAVRNVGEVLDRGKGTVVFFFSGHGFAVGARNYLATYESTALNLSQSGLALEDLQQQLQETGAARRILWIDACRNQPGKSVADARSFANFQAAAGTRILFSTKAGKLSYENDDLRHGVFTHFLIEGLRGGAAGNDGLVTFRDLADYVSVSVRDYSLKRGDVQVPYDAGEGTGEFLIARGSAVSDPGPSPRENKPENRAENRPEPRTEPATATLLVESDADATFTVDAQPGIALRSGQVQQITLTPGGHILRASVGGATWRKTVDIRAGEQQAVVVELAKDIAEAAMRRMEGTWTCRGEAEGRFTTNNRRFHEKYNISLQISRSGDGFAGVWQQEREFKGLDSPDNANENYTMRIDAAFRLRLDGNRLTGISESVHRQDSSGSKQDYNAVAFTGTPVSPNSLAVEIVWERDAQGRAMNGATCTLEKRQ